MVSEIFELVHVCRVGFRWGNREIYHNGVAGLSEKERRRSITQNNECVSGHSLHNSCRERPETENIHLWLDESPSVGRLSRRKCSFNVSTSDNLKFICSVSFRTFWKY